MCDRNRVLPINYKVKIRDDKGKSEVAMIYYYTASVILSGV